MAAAVILVVAILTTCMSNYPKQSSYQVVDEPRNTGNISLLDWYPVLSNCQHEIRLSTAQSTTQLIFPVLLPKKPLYSNSLRSTTRFLILLLCISNDINLNPGPTEFPCGLCNKAVRWNQRGICCDNCDLWYHMCCINLSIASYTALENTSVCWICHSCGLPNFSSSFFDSTKSIDCDNSYNTLASLDTTGDSLYPAATSSPIASKRIKPHSWKADARQLKCLTINFQGISNKKGAVAELLHSTQPDEIIGTETWARI